MIAIVATSVQRNNPPMPKQSVLEKPSKRRKQEFLDAVERSRGLHGHWVTPPCTDAAFNGYLERLNQPANVGYFVLNDESELAGVINISEMVGGSFRSG